MFKKGFAIGIAAAVGAASVAVAQPRIVSLGDNAVGTDVANGGNIVVGAAGGVAVRWTISGSGVTLLSLPGSRSASGVTDDGEYVIGSIPNAGGMGGLPIDASLAARWSEGTGWIPLALVAADPALDVTGPGASGGEISSPKSIAGSGRFVVGQGYIAPDETYRFRPWYWDADANGGAGASHVLSTSFNPENNRFRDGRALGVNADGTVIVGGEAPNTSEGRVIVWRWNPGTSSYDATYLPDGVDAKGNPVTRSVDEFFINAAGTIIGGTTYELDKKTGFLVGPFIAKWTWDAPNATWIREVIASNLSSPASWWKPPPECDIPPVLILTGMSDDGSAMVGIVHYPICGSFLRGGFIWTDTDNLVTDLYDHLVAEGTPGITDFGPIQFGLPPRLGWANAMSSDGQSLTGYGGPFSGFGPGWVVNLNGGGCIEPFVTGDPDDVLLSRCTSFIMNAAAGGSGPLAFQWMKDGAPLADGGTPSGSVVSGATTSQLRISPVTLDDAGAYHCVITGACGSPVSTAVADAIPDPGVEPAGNDTCATASPIGEGTVDFSPCGAFVEDIHATACALASDADLWFLYTPTFTGVARIETCGANYDTVLSVFSACDGIEIICNDDRTTGPLNECSWLGSRLELDVVAGEPVTIRVANLGFLFEFSVGQISIAPAPPAAPNDNCENATVGVIGTNEFSTDEATNDGFTSCGFAASGRDVWFSFTAPGDGLLDLTTCGDTFWDTVLTIYDGCFGNELACNDDTGDFKSCYSQSTIEDFKIRSGDTYLIRIGVNFDSDGGGTGVLTIDLNPVCGGDFNNDGTLNSQDFFDFLNVFFEGDPSADFNEDDVVNSQDFFDFLNVFFAGC